MLIDFDRFYRTLLDPDSESFPLWTSIVPEVRKRDYDPIPDEQAIFTSSMYHAEDDGDLRLVQIPLPGVPRDKIEVYFAGCTLKVEVSKDFGGRFAPRRRAWSFTLPRDFTSDDIKVQLKDGVLHLTFPLTSIRSSTPPRTHLRIE